MVGKKKNGKGMNLGLTVPIISITSFLVQLENLDE